jgi:hypothetical protein
VTRKLAAVVVVTAFAALAGCSGAEPSGGTSADPPRLGAESDEPTVSPGGQSSEPEPSRPARPGTRVEDSVEVTAGAIDVEGEQERLVADAFVRYTSRSCRGSPSGTR